MTKSERSPEEKILYKDARVVCVADYFPEIRQDLANIYFESWNSEGLCTTLQEAQSKIDSFDPHHAFVVLDSHNLPLGLVNTLLTDCTDIKTLISRFPTYHSVELESAKHRHVAKPTFRICFSIVAVPNARIYQSGEELSVSRFLLDNLPNNAQKLAYSRHPAVGMHQHFGAKVAATIDNSRPEDHSSKGQNVLMLYP